MWPVIRLLEQPRTDNHHKTAMSESGDVLCRFAETHKRHRLVAVLVEAGHELL